MNYFRPTGSANPLNRKKTDPSNYVFTGKVVKTESDIQLFSFSQSECIETKGLKPGEIQKLSGNGYCNWLNVHGISQPDLVAAICHTQEIHALAIQDILDVNQRPKYQEYEHFSFLTLKSILPSDKEILTEQISFIAGDGFLVSFQERKADFFEHLRVRLRDNKGILRERTVDYLLYAMLEAILDNYFKTLSKLDEEVETLNFVRSKGTVSPDVLVTIENHKKFVHFIKKSILPIKEFTQLVERGECSFVEQRHKKYFLEIKDLCLTLIDSSDMLLSSLESATNLFFSVQGHRMNEVMKTLTVVTSIFIPLTFVAGIYGMNFSNMPELRWKYGYFALLAFMVLMVAAMVIYIRKKRW